MVRNLMSANTPRPATRFGDSTAIFVAIGFVALASWPYLSHAVGRLTQGKAVTTHEVKMDVAKAEKAQMKKAEKHKEFEPKAVLALSDGVALVGGKGGLREWRNGELMDVPSFGGMDVRALATGKDGAHYAAAKDGLWKRTASQWTLVHEGDFHGISASADGALFVAGKMGVLRSSDGATWEPLQGIEGEKHHDDHD